MRVAALQLAPKLGSFEQNLQKANALLAARELKHGHIDLLVLPELAFSGYNFPSVEAITPYLEPTGAGPSTKWAAETAALLGCHVIVGYPEIATAADGTTKNYNSTVAVNAKGEVVANYRKSFLYYTDETWAEEGAKSLPPPAGLNIPKQDQPFFCGPLGDLSPGSNIGLGICMDINPYRFAAPWSAYEFASSMLEGQARIVILSMAWLTRLMPGEVKVEPDRPDMETVAYWLERFHPFLSRASSNPVAVDGHAPPAEGPEPIVVVFANRCGIEGNKIGAMHIENGEQVEEGDRVCYAGSSCVMRFQAGNVRMYEKAKGEVAILGKGEEGVLVVDTEQPARFLLTQKMM
ncbi:Carbon-nitrogen hydrolase [Teratosphaeria destructans]|uniref:Carbon-nitrogen hydrolase n=1 Tax=Teratosphaeria destructans TaxID=418781 RepID=A0A9W7SRL9_9PEZI|nr:Carbon-nitrogen hydrolase [Teratosphaeria destructans]